MDKLRRGMFVTGLEKNGVRRFGWTTGGWTSSGDDPIYRVEIPALGIRLLDNVQEVQFPGGDQPESL